MIARCIIYTSVSHDSGPLESQRVRKNTSLTETLETGTCCCPSETRKGPIEPEQLQTNFPFVSPLQTVRAPDTEPPVSHDRTCPYTRAGWLPPRQILYCRGVSSHHFSSTHTQTTSIFIRARAALCMQATLLTVLLHRAHTLHQSRKY